MDEDLLKRNLTSGPTWLRALYMVLFGVAFYFVTWFVIAIAVIQLIAKLISGTSLARLDAFGAQLALYMRELVAFLTFAREVKPFPLGPWPDVEPAEPTSVSVSDRPDL
jgi:hypothetical protein